MTDASNPNNVIFSELLGRSPKDSILMETSPTELLIKSTNIKMNIPQKKITDNTLKKNRCEFQECNKKTGIIPFECRCKLKYCTTHRLPESHTCTFDYKSMGKEELTKKNPQIVAEKITKI